VLKKIQRLQDYLGPKVGYTSDVWPDDPKLKKLMKRLYYLKVRYYRRFGKE